jgi:hypothetical protein
VFDANRDIIGHKIASGHKAIRFKNLILYGNHGENLCFSVRTENTTCLNLATERVTSKFVWQPLNGYPRYFGVLVWGKIAVFRF